MLLKADILRHSGGNLLEFGRSKRTPSSSIPIQLSRLAGGDELHFAKALHETDIVFEDLIGGLTFVRSLGRRQPPLFARRVGAAAKIDAVPKLLVNKFAGMVHRADDSTALLQQLLARFQEPLFGRFQVFGASKAGT